MQKLIVEVNAGGTVAAGKIAYFLVGLPDNAVKESYQRVEAAIKNISFTFPRVKIVINLAPADLRKEGSAYDLPIAIGILAATKQIQTTKLEDHMILGELSLTVVFVL
jgi:magnesium chelatase family protein